MPIELG